MVAIKGTTVKMTRGDTVVLSVQIKDQRGKIYTPGDGDVVRFAMKKEYSDSSPVVLKNMDMSSMTITIDPADTKPLDFGVYVYDIELTKADGTVDTFIPRAKWVILEEVD